MGIINVVVNGEIVEIPTIKGDKGVKGDKGDRGDNGMTIIPVTESQYASLTPENGVLYIVTSNT